MAGHYLRTARRYAIHPSDITFVSIFKTYQIFKLDLRNPENRSLNFTKSINLALSERGINGIRSVDPDLLEGLLEDTIPMHGRMIHDKKGKQSSQKYDVHGRVSCEA